MTKKLLAISLLIAVAFIIYLAGGRLDSENQASLEAVPSSQLPQNPENEVTLEESELKGDIDISQYVTIREAEDRHIQALIRQLSRFGVEVPENPYLGNVFAPSDLQTAAKNGGTLSSTQMKELGGY
jgi:hypothetical protein